MARTGVTFDDVAQAATKLLSTGEPPSVQKIRDLLGTGSNTTIAEHLKRWKLQKRSKEGITLPEEIPKELVPAIETVWHIAIEHADQRYLTHKQQSTDTINTLTAERDTWLEITRTLEVDVQHMKEQLSNEQHEKSNALLEQQALKEQINELNIVQTRLTTQLDDTAKEMSAEQSRAHHAQQQLELRYSNAKEEWQQSITLMKSDLEKEQKRSDQSEDRWMRIVDQMKDELKKQEKLAKESLSAKEHQISELNRALSSAQAELVKSEKTNLQLKNEMQQKAVMHEHIEAHNQSLLLSLEQSEARLDQWQHQFSELLEIQQTMLNQEKREEEKEGADT